MSFTVRQLKNDRPPRKKLPLKKATAKIAGVSGPLFTWYRSLRSQESAHQEDVPRTMQLKRIMTILFGVLCALLIVAGVAKAMVSLRIITFDSVLNVAGAPPPVDANGFTNILLLGHGDKGHSGQDLTDSIMIVSIDAEKTKSVAVLSIPRDTHLLQTENMGAGKINGKYREYKSYLMSRDGLNANDASQASMKEFAAELGRKLGLDIHHVIKVDFSGFEKAIDELGGVEVMVSEAIYDEAYPDENYGYEVFSLPAGLQTLNGATALKYARSRHSTSDFDRSARQQQVLEAMAKKAKESGLETDPLRVVGLLKTLSEHIETTMPANQIVGLANIARKIDRSQLIALALNDRNALYNGLVEPGGFLYAAPREQFGGASTLLPLSVPPTPVTWKQIQTLVKLMFIERTPYLADPEIAILNAGARSGLARVLATELIRYDFNVPIIENADIEDRPQSTISYRAEEDAALAQWFADLLRLEVVPLPVGIPPEKIGRLTIILGSDYEYSPFQDLVPAT